MFASNSQEKHSLTLPSSIFSLEFNDFERRVFPLVILFARIKIKSLLGESMPSVFKTLVLALGATLITTPSWSQSGYDQIIDDLTSRKSTTSTRLNNQNLLSDVKIYLGAGWVNSFFQPADSKTKDVIWHSGVMLSLGIDLFSRHWVAEGSIKN